MANEMYRDATGQHEADDSRYGTHVILTVAEYKSLCDERDQALIVKEKAEAEARRQTDLNRNLLRIAKERANAQRGLKPKKVHDGYRFVGKIMQTKTVFDHDKEIGAIYKDVWTATLETPYNAALPIKQIIDHIFEDLKGSDGVFSKLDIHQWTFSGSKIIQKGAYIDAMKNNTSNDNCLFDYKFIANPKSGLQEIQITTTKAIKVLAEMM